MMLVSPEYQAQLQQIHSETPGWGTTGRDFAALVNKVVQDYVPGEILDYGCGKQTLSRALPQYQIIAYDPGIPGIDAPPNPADFVICTDVLEHVEQSMLEDVLDDLQRVTKEILFVAVAEIPAIQILPDGRNAHLITEPLEWWLPKLMERFKLVSVTQLNGQFHGLFGVKRPEGNGKQ